MPGSSMFNRHTYTLFIASAFLEYAWYLANNKAGMLCIQEMASSSI